LRYKQRLCGLLSDFWIDFGRHLAGAAANIGMRSGSDQSATDPAGIQTCNRPDFGHPNQTEHDEDGTNFDPLPTISQVKNSRRL
jgi:hypothetical protein